MIATIVGITLFGWSYSVLCTSVYGTVRASLNRAKFGGVRVRAPSTSGAAENQAPALLPNHKRVGRVLLVRPCAGLEPALLRSLSSIATPPADVRVSYRFAIGSASDPALPIVQAATASLRKVGVDAAWLITQADAPNHKAAQIEAVLANEPNDFDYLVVADSDVDLEPCNLEQLLAPMISDPNVGAVWAPPIELAAASGTGDRASKALLSSSLHAFTILGALDSGSLVGKLFALDRSAVQSIGGFTPMTRVLGEDMEIGRRVREKKRTVRTAPFVAVSLKSGRSWQNVVQRYARWLAVIRAQRPHLLASYPLLFFSAPLLLILSALLFPFAPQLAVASAGVALAGRFVSAFAARRLAGIALFSRSLFGDVVLADALLMHAFVRALFARTLTWRGRTLTIDRQGSLSEKAA